MCMPAFMRLLKLRISWPHGKHVNVNVDVNVKVEVDVGVDVNVKINVNAIGDHRWPSHRMPNHRWPSILGGRPTCALSK